jgi:hypothetical protein
VNEDFKENDPLWDALGRCHRTHVPDRFAPDVIRAIRHRPPQTSPWRVATRWLVPAAAAACLAVIAGIQIQRPTTTGPDDDFEAVFRDAADLDSLVASSAGWAWQEVAP